MFNFSYYSDTRKYVLNVKGLVIREHGPLQMVSTTRLTNMPFFLLPYIACYIYFLFL